MPLELDSILITGRTFGEYCAFFDLDVHGLRGKKVLDCPGGASSFVRSAKQEGADAKAVDPLYAHNKEALCKRGKESIETIYRDTGWMAGNRFEFYESIVNHRRFREKALREFGRDYNRHDYLNASLPSLPFEEGHFDLVLSSHLLFVYDDRLDEAFHLEAIREMMRVGKEVRIFPLVDFKNSREGKGENFSPLLYRMLEVLDDVYEMQVCSVPFCFQPGSDAMLRITHRQDVRNG